MGSNRKDHGLFPDGIEKEFQIAVLLRRLGFRMTITTELDEDFATDILVTGHRKIEEKVRPVALQTSKQRKMRGKARRFVARAGRRIKGPLLYVRCRGTVSLEKVESLGQGIFALWLDPEKKLKRAHGIALHADGSSHWFSIPQP